ncbi:aldose 1-epimerase family protein [Microvirga guangxiensis]|uniref:Galactose mutarotase n=1 Tax=Microvirga guangxiensis TaxID=549386 RepID=A0A1G5CE31_9HYPH|nr:aldose 1-epimerase family protein [Microvirga guangxiensis]SCY00586.1 Galactose mutarotase [Microvirga guangxiensis]
MRITLSNSHLKAQIVGLGAELVALQDEAGHDLLWDGEPTFWTGRSPLLFPIVGRLRDDRTLIEGRPYSMKQHGFARASTFDIVDAGTESCRLRLSASDETREQYPFDFRLDVTYRVDGARLVFTASVFNLENRAIPVSFGFHPALRWPLPYGGKREAHEIRFEKAEAASLHTLAEGLVGEASRPSPLQGDRLPLHDGLFQDGALVWSELKSRTVRYGVPGRRSLSVSFPDMPHLGIWTKPGAGYVCIEPWQGYADPVGFAGEFKDKPGIVMIPAGENRDFSTEIIVDPPNSSNKRGPSQQGDPAC